MAGGKIDILVEPDARQFPSKLGAQLRASSGALGAVSKGIGLAVAAGTGLAAVGLKKVIDLGIEYQSNLNNLQAVTGATGEKMVEVSARAKALGSDLSLPATSAADAAKAMLELAKSGLSVDEAMVAAKGTLQLAAAAQIDGAAAAEIQGNALNQFGLEADQAGHVADVLANTANAASGEITDMAAALQQVGAVAHQFGISIDDTATALGLLANAGIKGSDAGTLLKTALTQLAAPSAPAAKAMKTLGLNAFDASGKFVGLKSVMDQLHDASGRLTTEQYAAATATVFGTDAVRLAGVAAQTTGDDWDKMAASVSKAGGAQELAAAKTKGLGGAIDSFKSQLETVGIDVFERIGPALEKGVRIATDVVNDLGPKVGTGIDKAIDQVAKFGPGILVAIESKSSDIAAAGTKLFTPIADGARGVVEGGILVAQTAIGGFTDTLRDAADAAQPVADGIGRLGQSASNADGPLHAVATALGIGYDAAQLVIGALAPLLGLVGDAIGLFGALPGPIQTAAIALLALKIGPQILGALKSSFSGAGTEAEGAATKTGLFGKAVSTITAPVRAVAAGAGAAAGTIRQFGGEIAVQRSLAESAGQSTGRLAGAVSAFQTSTVPAVAAARGFAEQTSAIKAAAAGAGQPISTMGAAIGTLVERSSGLSQVRDSFRNAADGASRFSTLAGTAAGAATGVKLAAGGLVSALGGPWGIALAGAGIFLSLLAGHQQEAAAAAAAHKQQVDSLTQSIRQNAGALGESGNAAIAKALSDKNAGDNAKAAGLNLALYTNAATGNTAALTAVKLGSDEMISSILRSGGATEGMVKAFTDANGKLLETGGSANDARGAFDTLSQSTEGGVVALTNLTDAQVRQLDAILNGTGAVGEQIKAAKEAADAYYLQEQAVTGLTRAQIEARDAQTAVGNKALEATAAQNAYVASVTRSKTAIDDYNTALKSGDEGKKAAAVQSLDQAYLAQIQSLGTLTKANSKASTEQGKAAEATAAQNREVLNMVKSLGTATPGLEKYISGLSVGAASAAGFAVSTDDLGNSVVRLPDGKVIKLEADPSGAKATITGFKDEADALHAQVTVGADIDPATGKVLDWKNTTSVTIGNTTTYTNVDPATGQVRQWTTVTDATGATTTTYATTDPATGAVTEWKRLADGTWAEMKAKANTAEANAALDEAARTRTALIIVKTTNAGSPTRLTPQGTPLLEKGGIVQAAVGYASGGVHKLNPMRAGLAQIVKPNTWRVVGDRVRDDEFYIPDDNSPRSLALLRELAHRRGLDLMQRYADGGIAARTASRMSVTANIPGGPQQIVGTLDLGNGLTGVVRGEIQSANASTGAAIRRRKRY